MGMGTAYWVLMLIWLIFGVWFTWPNYRWAGANVLLFILLVLLGWKVFGAPIHG